MMISIGAAIVAFIVGAVVYFKATHVKHRSAAAVLTVVILAGSLLYDNAAYLFDSRLHPDSYIESTCTVTKRGTGNIFAYDRGIVSYYDGEEAKWSSVPIAFYEDVPMKIPILQRDGPGRDQAVTRTQITVTARTLILTAFGLWILLACAVRSSRK